MICSIADESCLANVVEDSFARDVPEAFATRFVLVSRYAHLRDERGGTQSSGRLRELCLRRRNRSPSQLGLLCELVASYFSAITNLWARTALLAAKPRTAVSRILAASRKCDCEYSAPVSYRRRKTKHTSFHTCSRAVIARLAREVVSGTSIICKRGVMYRKT